MKNYTDLFKYIVSSQGKMVEFTKRLVEIPTVNPPGLNYENIVTLIEKECRHIGLSTKRIIVPKGFLAKNGVTEGSKRINLIAHWNVGAKKTLHINGHYDVVPVGDNWKTGPFKPVVKNGKLFGRGSEDMKANTAAYLFAVKALKHAGLKPGVNLEFSFTPDEETGGRTGLGYAVEKGFLNPDYAIGEGHYGRHISYGNKGILWMRITVKGKSAHGSTPHKGVNAFIKGIALVSELEIHGRHIAKRKTRYNTFDKSEGFATMLLGGEVSGSSKINTVPDTFSFSIDRRLIPEESLALVRKEILSIVNKFKRANKGVKIIIEYPSAEKPVVIDEKNPLCRAMVESVRAVLKKEPRFALMTGGTDMRFFIYKGIPSIGYSVACADRAHASNEFVYVKGLVDATKVFALLMLNLK